MLTTPPPRSAADHVSGSFGLRHTAGQRRNPEDLTSKFGRYTGPVLGDGFDKVPLFTSAIEELIENEGLRKELSCKAVEYIREIHPVHKFQQHMRKLIHDLAHK